MFREYTQKGNFSVLIPYKAHSAATVISLGADEIVMTKKAELGPIDVTITGPYNPLDERTNNPLPLSVEDVTGYFSLLEKIGCERPDEKMKGFELITQKIHPLVIGKVYRLLEETKLVANNLLSTRDKPFNQEKNNDIIEKISSKVFSHRHAISRTEAKDYIGLEHVKKAEDEKISNELWGLYEEYNKYFNFDNPFNPEEYLIENNLNEYQWDNLPLACIESTKRFDVLSQDVKLRKILNVPPKVDINISNLSLPSININDLPDLPDDITKDEFIQIISSIVASVTKNTLSELINTTVDKLIKQMPQVGYEKAVKKYSWKEVNEICL